MKDKISITLDEKLIKYINIIRGDVPRSKFIENYLRDNSGLFEALWIYDTELKRIGWKERMLAHVSQPTSKPLHKHEGFVGVSGNDLIFYDKEMQPTIKIAKKDIKKLKVSYDDKFKRFKDSRGLIAPLHFHVANQTIYIFTKSLGGLIFKGDNQKLIRSMLG